MTDLIQSKPSNTIAPEGQASRLLGLVKEIEKAAKEANVKVAEIESRGFFKNLVISSRDDLVSTARSQSRINDLLVRLNQEVVALNTLGYVYLASVFAEFERQINEGVRDSDGKIHALSESGKRVASAAKEMFSAILDSSRSTQEKIDATAEATDALRADVDRLTDGAFAHSELIHGLQVGSSTLLERSERLGALAAEHSEAIVRTAESVRKLIAVEGEITAQLEFLLKSYRVVEHDVPTLAAQMAKMTASQDNESHSFYGRSGR